MKTVRKACIVLTVCLLNATLSFGMQQVSNLPARELDNQHGFRILVWQHRTNAQSDQDLYEKVNLSAWHIDRGKGQLSKAKWSRQMGWPYYVDHAAGKGILHLTQRSGLNQISRDGKASDRPWSFFDPETTRELIKRLEQNVPEVLDGPVMAIALDDEVSVGSFNSPLEVDFCQPAMEAFRTWLPKQYSNSKELTRSWNRDEPADFQPMTYEKVRSQIRGLSPAKWRLAPWIDFRVFMDSSQSDLFGKLVQHTNQLAPGVPAGVVGGQQPSAYGGFDYSKLRHSLQWIESYDIGGTNEILRSFWSETPRRGRMQTYFLAGDLAADKWFLWYYLAHGCRSVIAWPERNGKPWFANGKINPEVQSLAPTFKEVQNEDVGFLSHPETRPIFSPIGILYSQPSIHVGWAIDAAVHGKTWPRRSSSLDNKCLSSGKNRVAWTRLLEDLGYQPRFLDTTELIQGNLAEHGIKLLVLPQTFALSVKECQAITDFVKKGGQVVADYGTAIVDEHGNGFSERPLDHLFGIKRSTEHGWWDGQKMSEIDGEKYSRPFRERFVTTGVKKSQGFTLVERNLEQGWYENSFEKGKAVFLNTSPTIYFDAAERAGELGSRWRRQMSRLLAAAELKPIVRYQQSSGRDWGVEVLPYTDREGKEYWVFVANPTRQAAVDGAGSGLSDLGQTVTLRIEPDPQVEKTKCVRTGQEVGETISFRTDEALILEITRKPER